MSSTLFTLLSTLALASVLISGQAARAQTETQPSNSEKTKKPLPRSLPAKPSRSFSRKKPDASSDTKVNAVGEREPFGNWNLGLTYNLADKVLYRGSLSGGSVDFGATDNTTPAFGLRAGYQRLRPWWFGFDASLVYELPRGSSGIDARAGSTYFRGTYQGDPKTSLLVAELNGNYSIGSMVYLFAGINFPFVFISDASSGTDLHGLIGRQYGIGITFLGQYSLEAGYRLVGLRGTTTNALFTANIDEANLAGIMIGARYAFK